MQEAELNIKNTHTHDPPPTHCGGEHGNVCLGLGRLKWELGGCRGIGIVKLLDEFAE